MSQDDIIRVARIVFGEARGEPPEGQLAVAYTVVNRKNHPGFPKTIHDVFHHTYIDSDGKIKHQYETLDRPDHHAAWNYAEHHKTVEYQGAIVAATDALLELRPDPTYGATNFASNDPDPATSSNEYYEVIYKTKIGNHYFVHFISKP